MEPVGNYVKLSSGQGQGKNSKDAQWAIRSQASAEQRAVQRLNGCGPSYEPGLRYSLLPEETLLQEERSRPQNLRRHTDVCRVIRQQCSVIRLKHYMFAVPPRGALFGPVLAARRGRLIDENGRRSCSVGFLGSPPISYPSSSSHLSMATTSSEGTFGPGKPPLTWPEPALLLCCSYTEDTSFREEHYWGWRAIDAGCDTPRANGSCN